MNPLLNAWETTVEDVENVLRGMGEDIALAPELFLDLDCENIARAALDAGTEFADQLDAAYTEIESQLKSKGICK